MWQIFQKITDALFQVPAYVVYKNTWWGGRPETAICADLSPGTTEQFWLDHQDECVTILQANFHKMYTPFVVGIWFALVWWIVGGTMWWIKYSMWQRPTDQMMVKLMNRLVEQENSRLCTHRYEENATHNGIKNC